MCSIFGAGAALMGTAGTVIGMSQDTGRVVSSAPVDTSSFDIYAAEQKARSIRAQGDLAVNRERRRASRSEGRAKTLWAARNVALSSGSAIDLLVDNRTLAQERMDDIRYESNMKAWDYDMSVSRMRALSTPRNVEWQQDSWMDTLSNPLFIARSAEQGFSLLDKYLYPPFGSKERPKVKDDSDPDSDFNPDFKPKGGENGKKQ